MTFLQGTRQLLRTGTHTLRKGNFASFKTKRGILSQLLQVCCDFRVSHRPFLQLILLFSLYSLYKCSQTSNNGLFQSLRLFQFSEGNLNFSDIGGKETYYFRRGMVSIFGPKNGHMSALSYVAVSAGLFIKMNVVWLWWFNVIILKSFNFRESCI